MPVSPSLFYPNRYFSSGYTDSVLPPVEDGVLSLAYASGSRSILKHLPLETAPSSPTADVRQLYFAIFEAMFTAWSRAIGPLPPQDQPNSIVFTKETSSSWRGVEHVFRLRFRVVMSANLLEETDPVPQNVGNRLETNNVFGSGEPINWLDRAPVDPSVYFGGGVIST